MDLYICHTSYQVLIALIRAIRQGGDQALLLSTKVPGGMPLWQRLQSTGAFAELAVVDEEKWPAIVSGPFARWRNKRAFEQCCGWYLQKNKFENIYICNDWSALGRYLQDCRTEYILCEDTVASTLGPDQHLVYDQREEAKTQRLAYQYWGDSPYCKLVESEDADQCTLFPREKMVTFSRRQLLASLTSMEKSIVRQVFLTQPLPDRVEGATLLLTRSFVEDGMMTQEHQDALFKAVAKKYAKGQLFIKTHPRDTTDYTKLFPDAIVLERTMPSEVLNFCLPFRFARAVAVQSFVLRGFTAADEMIDVTLEDAEALL